MSALLRPSVRFSANPTLMLWSPRELTLTDVVPSADNSCPVERDGCCPCPIACWRLERIRASTMLAPAATIGLTASVDATDHVIYTYPLYRAISDRFVKAPVLAFREAGYDATPASEEQQLRDALALRAIKQAHYDAYAQANNRPSLNAVAFVVCSDVDHATQVAELLRTPEFLGREDAVLQVDTKHDDGVTQHRLNELDAPHSSVLAVVSVNKLKEGWDVKNVAVVVTLRAMASEVLTQQTMGRGLRLPFGRYTGVGQIDQLDIIAHQSFTELLAAENVLQQFGLEDTTTADPAAVQRAIRDAGQPEPAQPSDGMTSTGPGASATGSARPTDQTPGVVPVEDPGEGDSLPRLGVRSLDSDRRGGDGSIRHSPARG